MANQAGQEKRRTRLHDKAAARKNETNLRAAVRDAYVHGQSHGDADAYCGTLDGGYRRFAAVLDGQGYTSASVVLLAFSIQHSAFIQNYI
jgi:hypothetical protein